MSHRLFHGVCTFMACKPATAALPEICPATLLAFTTHHAHMANSHTECISCNTGYKVGTEGGHGAQVNHTSCKHLEQGLQLLLTPINAHKLRYTHVQTD